MSHVCVLTLVSVCPVIAGNVGFDWTGAYRGSMEKKVNMITQ